MNITTLSKLHIDCPTCGVMYFQMSHISGLHKKCRLCCEIIPIEDVQLMIDRHKLNRVVEMVYPRGEYDYFLGNNNIYQIHCLSDLTCSFIMKHLLTRLKKRTMHGEWKAKRRRIRRQLVARCISIRLNYNVMYTIVDYLSWEELAVMYRCTVAWK
jgi:hypothetical protein